MGSLLVYLHTKPSLPRQSALTARPSTASCICSALFCYVSTTGSHITAHVAVSGSAKGSCMPALKGMAAVCRCAESRGCQCFASD